MVVAGHLPVHTDLPATGGCLPVSSVRSRDRVAHVVCKLHGVMMCLQSMHAYTELEG